MKLREPCGITLTVLAQSLYDKKRFRENHPIRLLALRRTNANIVVLPRRGQADYQRPVGRKAAEDPREAGGHHGYSKPEAGKTPNSGLLNLESAPDGAEPAIGKRAAARYRLPALRGLPAGLDFFIRDEG